MTSAHGRRGPRPVPLLAAVPLVVLLGAQALCAQSLTGTTGLVSIPTAAMPADRTLTLAVNVIDRGFDNPRFPDRRALVQSASLGFLPFVEVGLRLTRALDAPRPQALGDRMVSVRVRLLDETVHRPAVVLGGQDLVGTRLRHAVYVVASKEVDSGTVLGRTGVHLGYGGNPLSLRIGGSQFAGVFGGVSAAPRPWLALLAEHDARRVNAGVRLVLLRRLAVLVAAQHPDGLSWGVSYTARLE
ncbi:MAG TPA: YjbH domain-containing protein [Longimicrobium sp.]|nr:YjbH domain-containing protein [Longimicrobium sp.]